MQLSDRTHELIPASEEIGLYGKREHLLCAQAKTLNAHFYFYSFQKNRYWFFYITLYGKNILQSKLLLENTIAELPEL